MSVSPDIIILAAGAGRRMRSRRPKPLTLLAGRPLAHYVLDAAAALNPRRILMVVPPQSEELQTAVTEINSSVQFVEQAKTAGTAAAAQCAIKKLDRDGTALIMCADTPLLRVAVLRRLLKHKNSLVLLAFAANNPAGYGRLLRDKKNIVAIVEEKDADAKTKKINEVYAGVMAAPSAWLKKEIKKIESKNAGGERYLTDLAKLAAADGLPVFSVVGEPDELRGINDAADLAAAENVLRKINARALLKKGVRLADDSRVDVRGQLKTGRDVEIDINAVFVGKVTLGDGCKIGANCFVENCDIGAHTVVAPFCCLQGAKVGARCKIGPYARLRNGANLSATVKIGNFVEVKNSALGKNTKASHLSYLGDSDIGENVNIGAGVITCNYDGRRKHRTVIGDDVFIGSDAQLIAPLVIGRGAFVAAGSTVTKTVPAGKLAIARARQKNVDPPAAET